MQRTLLSSLVAASLLLAGPARAQASNDAAAEALFLEGKALLASKRHEEACTKLAASYALDPATGTLLVLATCHEATNKTATAWAEFRKVAALSAGKREDRVALAREHEAALFPKLSYVTVVVSPAARVPGLSVHLDTLAIDERVWGTELPIDPGAHALRVSAPGKVASTQSIDVAAEPPEHKKVEIAPLEAESARPAEPAPVPAVAPEAPQAHGSQRTIGFVLGGVGVASLGAGAVFGLLAMKNNDDANQRCPDPSRCPSADDPAKAKDSLSAAKTDALVADVTLAAGVVLVGVGTYLVLSSPRLRVAPVASTHGAGLFAGGTF